MLHVQVTYRIRPDRLAKAENEISVFVDSLRNGQQLFGTYHIFKHTSDKASYVHLISFKDHETQLAHTQSAHVKTFVENMLGFCEAGPIYTELDLQQA